MEQIEWHTVRDWDNLTQFEQEQALRVFSDQAARSGSRLADGPPSSTFDAAAMGFKLVFELTPVSSSPMTDFSTALIALKDGLRVTRKGWNGPGQWVAMSPGFVLGEDRVYSPAIQRAIYAAGEPGNFLPYLLLRNAQGKYVPWVPTTGDLLAEDWETLAG